MLASVDRRVRDLAARPGRALSPRAERLALALAGLVFLASGVLAWRELNRDGIDLDWRPLVAIAAVGMPLTVFANASEYWLSGRLVGRTTGAVASIRVAMAAIAANMLPVPGSVLVRVRALASTGVTYGEAARSSFLLGIGWIAMTAALCGVALIGRTHPVVNVALLAAGALGFAWISRSIAARGLSVVPNLALIAGVESVAVVAAALRFGLALMAMGTAVDAGQSMALSSSGVLASMAGIFPGGLGLRELLAGALGSSVDIAAASGVAASVVDRLALVVVLSPLALLLSRSNR